MLPSDSVVMPLEVIPIIHALGIMLISVSLYNGEQTLSMQSIANNPALGTGNYSHTNVSANDKQANVKTAKETLQIESSEDQKFGTHDQNNSEKEQLQNKSSNKTLTSVFTYDDVNTSRNPAFRQYNLTVICCAAVLLIMLNYVACYVCSGFQDKIVLQFFTCLSIILYYCTLAQKISGTINSYTVCVLITFIMCVSVGHYSSMKKAGIKTSGGIQPERTNSVAI